MTRLTGAGRPDAGFTLLEMLVAIAVLGIIMIPLAGAFTVGLRSYQRAEDQIAGSTASLFASAYWASDVQSADSVTVPGTACAPTGTNVVTFAWAADPTAPTPPTTLAIPMQRVSYVVQSTASGRRLVRVACGGSSSTVNTIVPRLSATSDPQVTCELLNPPPTTAPLSACTQPAYAADSSLKVSLTLKTAKTKSEPDGVTVSVSGTRRSTTS